MTMTVLVSMFLLSLSTSVCGTVIRDSVTEKHGVGGGQVGAGTDGHGCSVTVGVGEHTTGGGHVQVEATGQSH